MKGTEDPKEVRALGAVDKEEGSQGPVEGDFPGHNELLSLTHDKIPSEQASRLAELARKLHQASRGPMEIFRGGGRPIVR